MVLLSLCTAFLVIGYVCGFGVSATDVSDNRCDVEGYYWKDYSGKIPPDAYPGGIDVNGKPTYIGQVFATYIIPAKIFEGDPKAYYEYGNSEHIVSQNIKILCTKHPEKFEWVKTSNEDIKLITDKHLVIGGYEPGCTTYIGRIRIEGQVVVGKALADNAPEHRGLHITNNGKKTQYSTFFVLGFNGYLT